MCNNVDRATYRKMQTHIKHLSVNDEYWIFELLNTLCEFGIETNYNQYYTDTVDSIAVPLDGFLIPGGRDLDPKFYGQENQGSNVSASDSALRWNFCKHWVENLPKEVPILGICFGCQVLNCLFGGTLVQELSCSAHHVGRKRKIEVDPKSWLAKALHPDLFLVSNCNHHQGLDKIPECFDVIAKDTKDNIPHALQYNVPGREIMAVIWHPEYSYKDTRYDDIDLHNRKVMEYFFDRAWEYKSVREKSHPIETKVPGFKKDHAPPIQISKREPTITEVLDATGEECMISHHVAQPVQEQKK